MPRITTITSAISALVLLGISAAAEAQPGQPVVQIRSDFSVVVTYAAPTPPPPEGAWLFATFNGAPYPGSPFNLGQATRIESPPLPLGDYAVWVVWGAQASAVTPFAITTVLGAPNLRAAGIDLDTVTLQWDPASGVVQAHDLEAILLSTGWGFGATIGPENYLTVTRVWPGTYSVRIRARNIYGVGPWSNSITLTVGRVVAQGDLQATLTWNSTADIDLHVIEPDGTHVYYGNKVGRSARLDYDDVDGFGPETAVVAAGRSLPGIYQIYIVHAGQNVETTSTVSITMGVNSDTAKTVLFTRRTRRAALGTAVMVAMVNVQTGEVVEMVSPTGQQLDVDETLLTGATAPAPPKRP